MQQRVNPVLLVLAAAAVLALLGLPFVRVAPNRLVSGEAVYIVSVLNSTHAIDWFFAAAPLALVLAAFAKPSRSVLGAVLATSIALMVGLLWLAAQYASINSQAASSIARVSLGVGFWSAAIFLALMASDALQRLVATPLQKTAAAAGVTALLGALLASGWCDDLSIMKEYANRVDGLATALGRHLQIVGVAMAFTLAIGLSLGWVAHASTRVAALVFPVLNVVQTIPSIALFGLLMAPLALLAAFLPVLGAFGISGVGMAPAVIALTLYGLLPVVRGTLAGLQQVSAAQINAARALGMATWAVLRYVAAPLALPVVLGGVRTAAVAAVGLAAVTALIGAGGLGGIMFEGLFSNAQDVVLLGVLPIIALGVLMDGLFGALISLAVRQARPHA